MSTSKQSLAYLRPSLVDLNYSRWNSALVSL